VIVWYKYKNSFLHSEKQSKNKFFLSIELSMTTSVSSYFAEIDIQTDEKTATWGDEINILRDYYIE
jgi:hypothetical protein